MRLAFVLDHALELKNRFWIKSLIKLKY